MSSHGGRGKGALPGLFAGHSFLRDFPGGLSGLESACQCGDTGSIPGPRTGIPHAAG